MEAGVAAIAETIQSIDEAGRRSHFPELFSCGEKKVRYRPSTLNGASALPVSFLSTINLESIEAEQNPR